MSSLFLSQTDHEVIHMEHESKKGTAENRSYDYDIDIQSCSTTDCTGLIPSGPQSDAEVEHYNQLYRFLPEHVSDPEN